MGKRGPVPKRSEQRRRRNKKVPKAQSAGSKPAEKSAGPAKAPKAEKHWHPVAKRWYNSLAKSGQSEFYEASDWAMAFVLAESMSRDLEEQVIGIPEKTGEPVYAKVPMKGASLSAYLKGMSVLLVSEGDRRRAELELQRTPPPDPKADEAAAIAKLDDYRKRAAG